MRSVILVILLMLLLQSCVLMERAEYRTFTRTPIEPPVAATQIPRETSWAEALASAPEAIISTMANVVVGVVSEVRKFGEAIVNGVRDVKTQTNYTERRVTYKSLFNTEDDNIEITVDENGATIKKEAQKKE